MPSSKAAPRSRPPSPTSWSLGGHASQGCCPVITFICPVPTLGSWAACPLSKQSSHWACESPSPQRVHGHVDILRVNFQILSFHVYSHLKLACMRLFHKLSFLTSLFTNEPQHTFYSCLVSPCCCPSWKILWCT